MIELHPTGLHLVSNYYDLMKKRGMLLYTRAEQYENQRITENEFQNADMELSIELETSSQVY